MVNFALYPPGMKLQCPHLPFVLSLEIYRWMFVFYLYHCNLIDEYLLSQKKKKMMNICVFFFFFHWNKPGCYFLSLYGEFRLLMLQLCRNAPYSLIRHHLCLSTPLGGSCVASSAMIQFCCIPCCNLCAIFFFLLVCITFIEYKNNNIHAAMGLAIDPIDLVGLVIWILFCYSILFRLMPFVHL